MTLEEAKKEIDELKEEVFVDEPNDYTSGRADALGDALEILEKVEPVGNPDKMTLKELARELRRIFKFKYLTAESVEGKIVALWDGKPFFTGYEWHFIDKAQCVIDIRFHHIPVLDLSEYADEDGEIDYSKCIVEV